MNLLSFLFLLLLFYTKVCPDLQVTPRTRLFAAVMNDVEILAMSDPSIHGAENVVKIMTDIDQDRCVVYLENF